MPTPIRVKRSQKQRFNAPHNDQTTIRHSNRRSPSQEIIEIVDSNDDDDVDGDVGPIADAVEPIDDASDLFRVSPKLNMPLEILDKDSIWSAATIIKLSKGVIDDTWRVTVRYEGWGSEWDEHLSYPNSRLARIFTYTKRVKCLAVLLSKKKETRGSNSTNAATNLRNWTNTWPCTVSFRMPHPGAPTRTNRHGYDSKRKPSSEQLLRMESNVFVRPYAPELLSSFLQKRLINGGWWITTGHLRLWKDFDIDNPLSSDAVGCVLRELSCPDLNSSSAQLPLEYHLPKGFLAAYRIALSDGWIRGCLPLKATSEGSLLDEKYRARNVGGDAIEGVQYSGAFPCPKLWKSSLSEISNVRNSPPCSPDMVMTRSPPNVKGSVLPRLSTVIKYEPPGVRRLDKCRRWASTLKIAGNDLFLGDFVSQTEAMRARQMTMEQCVEFNSISDVSDDPSTLNSRESSRREPVVGSIVDLFSVPIEAVISSYEGSAKKMTSFNLQDWIIQNSHELNLRATGLGTVGDGSGGGKRKQAVPKRRKIELE